MYLIDKNKIIESLKVIEPMNWTDSDYEIGERDMYGAMMEIIETAAPAVPEKKRKNWIYSIELLRRRILNIDGLIDIVDNRHLDELIDFLKSNFSD